MRAAASLLLLGLLLGCNPKGEFAIGLGDETDGRLSADVYTWDCQGADSQWMGVMAFDVSLEFVPDAVTRRALPPVGSCEGGMSMFAEDSLVAGQDIPDLGGSPRWETSTDGGVFEEVLAGYWYDEVFKNVMGCGPVEDTLEQGVELSSAGILSGATTPEPGELDRVLVDGQSTAEFYGGLEFGQTLDLSWEADDWEETFVQIRRERDGLVYETVTCNTTGLDSFEVDTRVWELLDAELPVDWNFLYVGFRNTDTYETDHGQIVDTTSRALHVVGLSEI